MRARIDERDMFSVLVRRMGFFKKARERREKAWWCLPGRKRGVAPQIEYGAVCDECNRQIRIGEGYLIKFHRDGYTWLYCEKCMGEALDGKDTNGTLSLEHVKFAGREED